MSLRRHLPTLLVVTAIVVINLVILQRRHWHSSVPPASALLRYGERIPRLSGRAISQPESIEVPGNQTNLILYLAAGRLQSRSVELAKYGEILYRKHGDAGLRITAIIRGSIPDIDTLVQSSSIRYDVIADADGHLGKALGLSEGASGVFLFDQNGLCRFSTDHVTTFEDLRQLVAVEFLKVEPFEQSVANEGVNADGRRLVNWTLSNVRSLETTTLYGIRSGLPSLLVLFTADCPVCSLGEHLKKLKRLADRGGMLSSRDDARADAALIFDFNFSRSDVLSELNRLEIKSPAYIANEKLEGPAYSAYWETSSPVQIVRTDSKGKIQRVLPLEAYEIEASASANKASQPANNGVTYEEIFRKSDLDVYDVTTYNGNYFVSDFQHNRVVVLDGHLNKVREIGRIGSGPGKLIHPADISVAQNGDLYVVDSGNDRIQRFTTDGGYIGELRTTLFEGFGVDTRGAVYLNQPEKGFLVTVYSASGEQLRSFGKLKTFSEVYGRQFNSKDEPYRIALNRVRLFIDTENSIYVTFMLAPIIQKYKLDGTLLFERRLVGPEIDHLTRVVVTDTPDKYISFAYDGLEARVIVLDPVIDPKNGRIYVVLADGSVYVADQNGERVSCFPPPSGQSLFPFMSGLGPDDEVLVVSLFRHCYRMVLPRQGA
ncbi:MAG: NHL repeat-containing protein [Blastocatellia bacterium]